MCHALICQFFWIKSKWKGQMLSLSKTTCKICNRYVITKDSNTMNLWNHLNLHHPADFLQLPLLTSSFFSYLFWMIVEIWFIGKSQSGKVTIAQAWLWHCQLKKKKGSGKSTLAYKVVLFFFFRNKQLIYVWDAQIICNSSQSPVQIDLIWISIIMFGIIFQLSVIDC